VVETPATGVAAGLCGAVCSDTVAVVGNRPLPLPLPLPGLGHDGRVTTMRRSKRTSQLGRKAEGEGEGKDEGEAAAEKEDC